MSKEARKALRLLGERLDTINNNPNEVDNVWQASLAQLVKHYLGSDNLIYKEIDSTSPSNWIGRHHRNSIGFDRTIKRLRNLTTEAIAHIENHGVVKSKNDTTKKWKLFEKYYPPVVLFSIGIAIGGYFGYPELTLSVKEKQRIIDSLKRNPIQVRDTINVPCDQYK